MVIFMVIFHGQPMGSGSSTNQKDHPLMIAKHHPEGSDTGDERKKGDTSDLSRLSLPGKSSGKTIGTWRF